MTRRRSSTPRNAPRANSTSARDITLYIIKTKRLDAEDMGHYRRLRCSVTDRRKRMAARGV